MNRLAKALEKILHSEEEIAFTEIFDRLPEQLKDGLKPDDLALTLERFLLQSGNTGMAASRASGKVVSRQSLFRNCAFRIQLTPMELANRQLVIGHRFQPFVHPAIPVDELHFFDAKDKPIRLIRSHARVDQENSIFFNLLPPYGLTQYLGDHLGQDLRLAILDLGAWLEAEQFRPEDQLLVSVRNYEKLEFYLEKLSQREITSLRLADRFYEKSLTEAIYQISGLIGKSFLPVDMHLFWAFAQMDAGLIEKAGPPFGPFISRHESLTFFQEGPYAFLQDKSFMEELMESALEFAKRPPDVEMGLATDLDGIFHELGNSFSRLLLQALMVEHLLEWDEIREETLYQDMFGPHSEAPFFNARQKKNFKRAFTKLQKSVQEQWSERVLALPHLQLLRKAIQFKMDIIRLLRELNAVEDPQQLDVQALLQLQPIDQSLDQILENLLSKKPMAYQEAQTVVRQLDAGREKFLQFRDDLLEE